MQTNRGELAIGRSLEIRGAGSKRLLPAGGSAREDYADLLALAVLRSATLHFTQSAQQPPKPLENSTGSKDVMLKQSKSGRFYLRKQTLIERVSFSAHQISMYGRRSISKVQEAIREMMNKLAMKRDR